MKKLKLFFILFIFTNAIAKSTINIIIFENKFLNDFTKENQSTTVLYKELNAENLNQSVKNLNLFDQFYSIKDPFIVNVIKSLEKEYTILYKKRVILEKQKILNLNYYNDNIKIIGKIFIKQNKFYDFYFDMDVIKNNYQLKMYQTIRSRKNKLNYVDHPLIGVLFYVE